MTLEINSLLSNRYRIERVLAHGGMGAIYRATDESLGVIVAVKENFLTNEESTRQFRREATILAGLRHSNLPRVTDHFVIEGQGQYLVMDFIEGEDLKQRIARLGHLPVNDVVVIGSQVCDALTYLHGLTPPVVHRDIKPGNIKITPEGQVYLVDFGLAKLARSGEHTTLGAQALTPGYAPPEQYGKGTDSLSDIYSLGATLYVTLTGKIPEDGLSRAMGNAVLIPMHVLNTQITQGMEVVINKAMSIYPQERYQTAFEFKQALLAAVTGSNDQATVVGKAPVAPVAGTEALTSNIYAGQSQRTAAGATMVAPSQSARTGATSPGTYLPGAQTGGVASTAPQPVAIPQKKRSGMTAIVAVVVVIVLIAVVAGVAGIVYFGGFLPKAPTTTATVGEVAQATQSPTAPVYTATKQMVVGSETPTSLAQLTLTIPPTQKSEPSLTPLPTLSPTITTTPTNEGTPVGGGGGQIAFASDRSGVPQIWIMSVDGRNQKQLTDIKEGACDPAWSPDGQELVFISPCKKYQTDYYKGSRMWIIKADGSGLKMLDSAPGGDFDPAWSPDGKKIAFSSIRNDQRPHIYIYNLADNTTTQISSQVSYDRRPCWSPDGQYIAFETNRGAPTTQVWYMKADGSNPRELSRSVDLVSIMPAWSPDGNLVVYSQGAGLPVLVSKSFKDLIPDAIQVSENKPIWGAQFSKDGNWIIFYTKSDAGKLLIGIMMNLTGGGFQTLTQDPGNDFSPVWRP